MDHIVVTGDITSSGDRRELDLARSLFEEFGILRSDRLSLVIGNHDIFGGVNTAQDILEFPSRLKRTPYSRKIEEFRGHFREAFEGCLFGSREAAFPFAKIVGHVALVGMNSVAHYSRITNPLGSNGIVRDDQKSRAKWMLSSSALEGLLKVVLIHHHFSSTKNPFQGTLQGVWKSIEHETLKLRDKRGLLKLFLEEDVRLVFHGHVHESACYMRDGIRFVNTGGSIIGKDPRALSAHIACFDNDDISVNRIILIASDSGKNATLRLIHRHPLEYAA